MQVERVGVGEVDVCEKPNEGEKEEGKGESVPHRRMSIPICISFAKSHCIHVLASSCTVVLELAKTVQGGRRGRTIHGFLLKVVVQVREKLADEGEEEGDSYGKRIRDGVFLWRIECVSEAIFEVNVGGGRRAATYR